jgi:ech hydrogenase subunit D
MRALADCTAIPRERLPAAALELRDAGWRFVTASCLGRDEGWTVVFHFERDEALRHLRVEVPGGGTLPAIDAAYPAAFLVENEIAELQGLRFEGMAIDYGGRLYRDFDGVELQPHGSRPLEGGR